MAPGGGEEAVLEIKKNFFFKSVNFVTSDGLFTVSFEKEEEITANEFQ